MSSPAAHLPVPARLSAHRWLSAARALWWAVALFYGLLFLAGLPVYFTRLSTVCDPGVCAATDWWVLTSAEALALAGWGASRGAYAAYQVAWEALLAAVFVGAGLVLHALRPLERVAYLVSLSLVVAGLWIVPNAPHALTNVWDGFATVDALLWLAALPFFAVILYLLPDGEFTPGWNRWFALGYGLVLGLHFGLAALGYRSSTGSEAPLDVVLASLVFVGVGVYGQVHRYRRVATLAQRQQLKWVGVGVAGWFSGILAYSLFTALVDLAPGGPQLAANLAGPAVIYLTALALPVALAFAVLRYRLWDIDVLIRRTLIYSVLTALLALAYFGLVVVLQGAFNAVTGESRSELVTVISTLAIAALFGPLRGRVQHAIDRRFYRRKYDATRTLAEFGAKARDVVELEQLTGQLVRVVDETMQPAHVGLWVRQQGQP